MLSERGLAEAKTGFAQELWERPFQLSATFMGGFFAVAWGSFVVLHSESNWYRALGVLVALAGVLLWISYVLRFQPALLSSPRWDSTRTRRAARVVLLNASGMYFVIAGISGLAYVVVHSLTN